MGANKDYNYSFQNPMPQYRDYINVLTDDEDLANFIGRHKKPITLKPSYIWITSRTGVNQPGVSPEEPALYIGDAGGNIYGFKYKYQNALLELIDNEDKNGIKSLLHKKLKPFDWKQVETQILTGYIFNGLSNKQTLDWDDTDVATYQALITKLRQGKLMGAFLPYYLAPESGANAAITKDYIANAMSPLYAQFQIGGFLLTKIKSNDIIAFVPDVDFMYHVDLSAFRGLGFGQMMKEYNQSMTDTSFAANHKAINAPKPEAITLLQNIKAKEKVKVTEPESKINDVLSVEEPKNVGQDTQSLDINRLKSVIEQFVQSPSSGMLVYNIGYESTPCKLEAILDCNKFKPEKYSSGLKIFIRNLQNLKFNPRMLNRVQIVIDCESIGDEINCITSLILYNDINQRIKINEVSLSESKLNALESVPNALFTMLFGSAYFDLDSVGIFDSFDEMIGRAIEVILEGKDEELSDKIENIECTDECYRVNMQEPYKHLSIYDLKDDGLKYELEYVDGRTPITYTGLDSPKDVIMSLFN